MFQFCVTCLLFNLFTVKITLFTKREQNGVTLLNKFLLIIIFAKTCIEASYMRHNNCLTRKLCTYFYTNASITDM